jgi:hypothetical protein
MKIHEMLEDQQLDELTAGQVGTAVGKGVGAVAKGVGSVAGGIAGAGKAFMTGFRSGKEVVGGTGSAAKPAAGAAPASGAKAASGQPAAGAAPSGVASTNLKTIQDAIAQFSPKQRAAIRTMVAKKAGVK